MTFVEGLDDQAPPSEIEALRQERDRLLTILAEVKAYSDAMMSAAADPVDSEWMSISFYLYTLLKDNNVVLPEGRASEPPD